MEGTSIVKKKLENIKKNKNIYKTFAFWLVTIVIAFIVLFPVVWLFTTSFKPDKETFMVPPSFLPHEFTFSIYQRILEGGTAKPAPWILNFFNSLKIALVTTVLTTILSALAGYGFARYRFPFKFILLLIILVGQMLPGPALLVPIAVLIENIGLTNTHTGLILLYTAFAVPFTTWLAIGNFEAIPREIEESALVDGCNQFTAFIKVVLPLSRIGLITTAIFAFLMSWSEFPFALVLIQTDEQQTMPLAMARLIREFNVFFNEMGAVTMLFTIPIFLVFLFAQKYFIRGIAAGALKG